MKPIYSSLFAKKGNYTGGIVRINVVPIEWIADDIEVDFETNKILSAVALIAGKQWMALHFNVPTFLYDEKHKIIKAGSFYDISVGGTLNSLNAVSQATIETLRYHQLVAVLTDRYKRQRIIGTKDAGLIFQPENSLKNTPAGQELVNIDMAMLSERPSPYVDDSEYILLPTEEDILLASDADFLLWD